LVGLLVGSLHAWLITVIACRRLSRWQRVGMVVTRIPVEHATATPAEQNTQIFILTIISITSYP
jgi:hypothetical protein